MFDSPLGLIIVTFPPDLSCSSSLRPLKEQRLWDDIMTLLHLHVLRAKINFDQITALDDKLDHLLGSKIISVCCRKN